MFDNLYNLQHCLSPSPIWNLSWFPYPDKWYTRLGTWVFKRSVSIVYHAAPCLQLSLLIYLFTYLSSIDWRMHRIYQLNTPGFLVSVSIATLRLDNSMSDKCSSSFVFVLLLTPILAHRNRRFSIQLHFVFNPYWYFIHRLQRVQHNLAQVITPSTTNSAYILHHCTGVEYKLVTLVPLSLH